MHYSSTAGEDGVIAAGSKVAMYYAPKLEDWCATIDDIMLHARFYES